MTSQSLKMAAIHCFLLYLYLSYLSFNFDWVCGILHDLIRACISDALTVNVAVPFNIYTEDIYNI